MTLNPRSPSRWEHISTTVPKLTKILRLRSNSATFGQTSRIDFSWLPVEDEATRRPSRMTIFSSCSWACCKRILSKPISSATLPDTTICGPDETGVLSAATPEAYFSSSASRKVLGFSAGRVGRTNEAAVGDLDMPRLAINQPINH